MPPCFYYHPNLKDFLRSSAKILPACLYLHSYLNYLVLLNVARVTADLALQEVVSSGEHRAKELKLLLSTVLTE